MIARSSASSAISFKSGMEGFRCLRGVRPSSLTPSGEPSVSAMVPDPGGLTPNLAADNPLDRGAAARQFLLQPLEAAVQMVNAVDGGLTLRHQPGDDQRDRGTQVGGHNLG